MGLDNGCCGMAERLMGVMMMMMIERGFKGFNAVEER